MSRLWSGPEGSPRVLFYYCNAKSSGGVQIPQPSVEGIPTNDDCRRTVSRRHQYSTVHCTVLWVCHSAGKGSNFEKVILEP